MKNLYLLFILFLTSLPALAQAQSPKAFSYQAVATDPNGLELSNQTISIRASIISSNINGQSEWIEQHQITTDPFGLFTLQIGEGISTGGSQTAFDAIKWSSDTHFLKIEMDPEGGDNFSLMGTNQLLAVPYALFADESNKAILADSASRAEFALETDYAATSGLADSSAIANIALTTPFADSSAIANMAHTSIYADSSGTANHSNTANFATSSNTANSAIFADTAAHASVATEALTATSALHADTAQYALEAEEASFAFNTQNAAFAQVAFTAVDDEDKDASNELQQLELTADSLRLTNGNALALKDLVDTSPVGTMNFPQGVSDQDYTFIGDDYTVPGNKYFYITAAPDTIRLPGVGAADGALRTGLGMPIFAPGTQIEDCKCIGFLADAVPEISPLLAVLEADGGNFFQVPAFKQLVIKSGIDQTTAVAMNNIPIPYFNSVTEFIIIPSGMRIANIGDTDIIITGYLKDIE